ncbi:MAG: chorismate mutase [Nanoarchaeota archaeon]|nr:chorismate mutase [Nanoarchaeota archaeon]MBU4086758.1 chorismate mutase [Nanoarchaeota archaeon]
MNQLEIYRRQIDRINQNILKSLKERDKISVKIGKYKKTNGNKVYDKKREQEIIKKIKNSALKNKLDEKHIVKIFKLIIKHSRKLQK